MPITLTEEELKQLKLRFDDNYVQDPILDQKFQAIQQKIENHLSKEDCTYLTIFTGVINGTSGDPSAAAKLIKKLLANYPENIKIYWIVEKDAASSTIDVTKFIMDQKTKSIDPKIELTVLSEPNHDRVSSKLWQDPLLIQKLQQSELLLSFPFDYLHPTDYGKFKLLQKKFISISEYDYPRVPMKEQIRYKYLKAQYRSYSTGFKEGGLFIEDAGASDKYSLEQLVELEHDSSIVSKLLNGLSASKYQSNHQLFFGYFNKDEEHTYNLINAQDFVIGCIKLSLQKTPLKNIDLFVNISLEQMQQMITAIKASNFLSPKELSHISFEYCSESVEQVLLENHSSEQKVKVRVLNGFPVKATSMQCLMQNADSFIGLTGDQSFVEGLTKGKLVCYQCMSWKIRFLIELITTCKKVCGENSKLYHFYLLQKEPISSPTAADFWSKLVDFYVQNEKTLKTEAQKLAKYLIEHKQIDKLLLPEILEEIAEAKQTRQKDATSTTNYKGKGCSLM